MKLLVETTGQFQLIDHDTSTLIRHEGYSVVMRTSFVEKWAMLGQIKFAHRHMLLCSAIANRARALSNSIKTAYGNGNILKDILIEKNS